MFDRETAVEFCPSFAVESGDVNYVVSYLPANCDGSLLKLACRFKKVPQRCHPSIVKTGPAIWAENGAGRKRGQPSVATRHKCLVNCDLRRFVPPNSLCVDVVASRDGDGAGWEHGHDKPSVFCGSDGTSRSPSRVPRCSSVFETNSNARSQRQNP